MRGDLRKKRVLWYSALLAVIAVALWVPLYNRIEPTLAGIPFFYWFQLALIIVAALITALAYRSGV